MKIKILSLLVLFLFVLGYAFFSNTALRYFFPDKVWAHKVNDINKLNKSEKFQGIELDVTFENGKLYVYHPPEPNLGLSFQEYLLNIKKDQKIWIDLKFSNGINPTESAHQISNIIDELRIDPTNFIIESSYIDYLNVFQHTHFKTSYYLPQELRLQDEAKLKNFTTLIEKQLSIYPTDYISSDYRDYYIIKKAFPSYKKLFWFTVYGNTNKFKARFLIWIILLDHNVDALLIPVD